MRWQPQFGLVCLSIRMVRLVRSDKSAAARPALGLVHQAGRPFDLELLLPGVKRVLGDADQRGEIAGGQAAAPPGVEDQQALLGLERRDFANRFGQGACLRRRPGPAKGGNDAKSMCPSSSSSRVRPTKR